MLADHIGIPQLRDLAGRSESYEQAFRVDAMQRLAELLYPESDHSAKELGLRVEFHGGQQGFPELAGRITGSLDLLCQRCLGALLWNVKVDFRLVVVGDEADLELVTEPFDAVVAGEHGISLTEIVEDEVLSSLPLAPMHRDDDNCAPSASVEIFSEDDVPHEQETNKPFGDLAAMLKQTGTPDGKTE